MVKHLQHDFLVITNGISSNFILQVIAACFDPINETSVFQEVSNKCYTKSDQINLKVKSKFNDTTSMCTFTVVGHENSISVVLLYCRSKQYIHVQYAWSTMTFLLYTNKKDKQLHKSNTRQRLIVLYAAF